MHWVKSGSGVPPPHRPHQPLDPLAEVVAQKDEDGRRNQGGESVEEVVPVNIGERPAGRVVSRSQNSVRTDVDFGRAVAGKQLYGCAGDDLFAAVVSAVGVGVEENQVAHREAVKAEIYRAVAVGVRRFAEGIGERFVVVVGGFAGAGSEGDGAADDRSAECAAGLGDAVFVAVHVVVGVGDGRVAQFAAGGD
jgi:hypothetical protein